jgi:hypothetical protein
MSPLSVQVHDDVQVVDAPPLRTSKRARRLGPCGCAIARVLLRSAHLRAPSHRSTGFCTRAGGAMGRGRAARLTAVAALGCSGRLSRWRPAARGRWARRLVLGFRPLPAGFSAALAHGRTVAIDVRVDNVNVDLTDDVQRALPSAIVAAVRVMPTSAGGVEGPGHIRCDGRMCVPADWASELHRPGRRLLRRSVASVRHGRDAPHVSSTSSATRGRASTRAVRCSSACGPATKSSLGTAESDDDRG